VEREHVIPPHSAIRPPPKRVFQSVQGMARQGLAAGFSCRLSDRVDETVFLFDLHSFSHSDKLECGPGASEEMR
jgi:hypothetical protein